MGRKVCYQSSFQGQSKDGNSHFSKVGVRSTAQKWAEDLSFLKKTFLLLRSVEIAITVWDIVKERRHCIRETDISLNDSEIAQFDSIIP